MGRETPECKKGIQNQFHEHDTSDLRGTLFPTSNPTTNNSHTRQSSSNQPIYPPIIPLIELESSLGHPLPTTVRGLQLHLELLPRTLVFAAKYVVFPVDSSGTMHGIIARPAKRAEVAADGHLGHGFTQGTNCLDEELK